jgi:hypothetical protein
MSSSSAAFRARNPELERLERERAAELESVRKAREQSRNDHNLNSRRSVKAEYEELLNKKKVVSSSRPPPPLFFFRALLRDSEMLIFLLFLLRHPVYHQLLPARNRKRSTGRFPLREPFQSRSIS